MNRKSSQPYGMRPYIIIQQLGEAGFITDSMVKEWAKHPGTALAYAWHVLNAPWPEGEEAISQEGPTAYTYAVDVLKAPWPRGERAIFGAGTEADYERAFWYARLALKMQSEAANLWVNQQSKRYHLTFFDAKG